MMPYNSVLSEKVLMRLGITLHMCNESTVFILALCICLPDENDNRMIWSLKQEPNCLWLQGIR